MTKPRATDLDRIIGRNIRRLRQEQGLTQTAVARIVGVSFQQVQKYEWGCDRISASRLWRLSQEPASARSTGSSMKMIDSSRQLYQYRDIFPTPASGLSTGRRLLPAKLPMRMISSITMTRGRLSPDERIFIAMLHAIDRPKERPPEAADAPPTLSLDIEKYRPFLEDSDISEDAKIELIQCLWSIMAGFADLGFRIDSVSLVERGRLACAVDGEREGDHEAE